MGGGDHCAVFGCDNDRRYPERQIKLGHVGILRFHSPKNKKEMAAWERNINRMNFKVKYSTRVCSNHFVAGYKSDLCWKPTLHMKGYPDNNNIKKTRHSPKRRTTTNERQTSNQEESEVEGEPPAKKQVTSVDYDLDCNESTMEEETEFSVKQDDSYEPSYIDCDCQGSSIDELKRNLFIEQATNSDNCYRYTGLSLPKLNLVFHHIKESASGMRYWKGSIDSTCTSKRRNKRGLKRLLPLWDEFVLTMVRLRKNFDVRFLADTFGISSGQVSRIYNTWVMLFAEELSFLGSCLKVHTSDHE